MSKDDMARGRAEDRIIGLSRRHALIGPLTGAALLKSGSTSQAATGPDRKRMKLTFVETWDNLDLYDESTNKGRWRTQYGYGGVDSEPSRCTAAGIACYVDSKFTGGRVAPFSLHASKESGKYVAITANHTPSNLAERCFRRPYTSGMLTTYGSFTQTYGYFEASVQVPEGKGYWPAFWGIPHDLSWSSEFDVFESLGERHITHLGVRWLPENVEKSVPVAVKADLTSGFHTYGLWWDHEKVVWYIDEVEYRRTPTPDGAHKPFFWLFNLAIGGDWAGAPTPRTVFPASLRVAWFKAWQLT